MQTYTFQKLSAVAVEQDFTSADSQHIIVEDGGNIRRIPKNIVGRPITTTLSDNSTDNEVPSAKAVYEALNTYASTTRTKEYGVRKLIESDSPDLERVGDAVGLIARACTGDEEVQNDFDNIYPWSHMKRCILSDDGEVIAYKGDINYSTNGYAWIKDSTYTESGTNLSGPTITPWHANLEPSYGAHCYCKSFNTSYTAIPAQVMVEIPKFYLKYETPGDGYEYWWVSEKQGANYRCSPLFDSRDKIYISAYAFSVVEESGINKATSASNVFPASGMTREQLRTLARARGAGWELPNVAYYCDIVQHLMLVEFATFNLSPIMYGHSMHIQADYGHMVSRICSTSGAEGSNTIDVVVGIGASSSSYFNYYNPGKTYVQLLTSDFLIKSTPRLITNIETGIGTSTIVFNGNTLTVNLARITIDGDPVVVTKDDSTATFCRICGYPSITGITDSLQSSSGQKSLNTSMCWRGLENIYSNGFQLIDGVNVLNYNAYLTLNPEKYTDLSEDDLDVDNNLPSTAYDFMLDQGSNGYTISPVRGYPKKLGYNPDMPWVRFPTGEEAATSNTGTTDTCSTGVSNYIYTASIGGGISSTVGCGIFSYAFNRRPANLLVTNDCTARLVY